MDRSREARRVTIAAAAAINGLSRRRHRSSSLRDSPEDDGPVELQETARLRDRKKDRDRERERERDRERDRERERDRLSRTSKRRRGDRLISNREDGGDDSSEESVNDDEDDDDEDGAGTTGGGGSVRMLHPNNSSGSLSMSTHHHHNHHHPQHQQQQQQQQRKSFHPPVKVLRTTPPAGTAVATTTTTSSTWKAADEMIGVSVPRKARSASTKRSHEWASSGGGGGVIGGEQIHRHASTSPVRTGAAGLLASPSPAPASPSSSNASMRKKMKPNGLKQRPPKSSSKSSSSAQEEIEIEIAEVLYGLMRQPQVPSKQEVVGNDSVKFDSREVNKPNNDAKSRVSSPISTSPSNLPQSSSILPSNSNSSATHMSAIAPKRKRPRLVKYEDETTTAVDPSIFPVRNSSISSTTTKVEIDQPAKIEASSPPNLEKNSGSVAENGGGSYELKNSSQAGPASAELILAEAVKEEKNNLVRDSKPLTEESESRDIGISKKEEAQSPKKESSPAPPSNPSSAALLLDEERENLTVTKANSMVRQIERQREEKFQIDLMAPPPSRSSPERDGDNDFGASDPKPVTTDMKFELKSIVKEDDKIAKIGKENVNVEAEDNNKKAKLIAEEAESHKPVVNKERNIDLQLDLEKSERQSATGSASANKLNHHVQKPQHQQTTLEKTAQSGSLPLPMSMASWPGGLPPMGYMTPLQGVVSMEGSAVSPAAIQPPHLLFTQPRPKRCATHCYIARNIHYHHQLMKMNPFWPAAPGSASLYGAKACNLNVVPPTELHGSIPGRGVNSVQDKGQALAIFPGHVGKEKASQPTANMVDSTQRKQILVQQALPPVAPSNILHGPAFIFPMSQQQAAAAASVRPRSVKSPPAASSNPTSSTSNSASMSANTPAGVTAAPAMSFNYPNMPGNETQYLAILQNNAYPFPIHAHVGPPPGAYRGNHSQPMPFIHGSFYPSQMLHPSQLQQQQQQPQPPAQLQQGQQGHQNTSMSSGSSSQKHLQNQHPRPHGTGMSTGNGNLQGFPAPKNQSPHPLQLQQRQQQPSQHASHQVRQIEGELGGEDSPSTADSRVSRANMNIYGQNFAMPLQPQNLSLMTAASMGFTSSGGSHGEKKQQSQQPSQQPGSKTGVEPLTSQAFAMSFASINGATTSGLDISSFAQNHVILQSLPENTRQGYQPIMAAAVAAQAAEPKKNNYHASEEAKRGTKDASNVEEERKAMAGKGSATVGQSIAFSRQDLCHSSVSNVPGNNVIDSSARTSNIGSAPARTSGSVTISGINASNGQQQLQRSQQQQQPQMLQLQKPHQFGAASAPRSKTPATSNGSAYSDHIPSSSMATKFPNALSSFPQNLVQSSNIPTQSPQWKNSVRTNTSQVPSPSLSTSASSSLKNIPPQQGRPQQSHTQISFASNPKSATQGQQPPSSTPSPSSPMVVGSPTTSISRSAGGSPRTTGSTSTGNKGGQASSLSSQQGKNSPSVPSRKSSPVGGRTVPSVLGNPHISSSSNMGTRPQVVLQQQQHQKYPLQNAQLFFSNTYMPAQVQHSPNTAATATASGGYYLQRQQQTQPPGSSTTSSTSMLSLCSPVTLANTGTTDPAKAVAAAAAAAAAASNMKGGGLPSQGLIHAAQFATTQSSGKPHQLMQGFPYVHAVSAAVQVKPAEQKQPAGE